MTSTLYSAEEVAEVLGLHVRTVRGYVRDGRLPAVRIGKQYRIAEQDLREFTGGGQTIPATEPRVEVSAIVQIEAVGRGVMDRITTHVLGAANGGSGGRRPLHVQTVYDETRNSLKVIVVGGADDTAKMITLISALAEQADT
ncbi:helix-turn-helix domain-containing protein [Mycobacterium sp. URHB0044]|uniref:helix-turn-helix domain-containing protein n=1 Tax=Mycobacterium sp. URHB0044 TaxID=1380386 RepID=UPI000566AEF3|nr:helix-turn-helix domain-containing protein [Mycobacterium sp. URHB0044]